MRRRGQRRLTEPLNHWSLPRSSSLGPLFPTKWRQQTPSLPEAYVWRRMGVGIEVGTKLQFPGYTDPACEAQATCLGLAVTRCRQKSVSSFFPSLLWLLPPSPARTKVLGAGGGGGICHGPCPRFIARRQVFVNLCFDFQSRSRQVWVSRDKPGPGKSE